MTVRPPDASGPPFPPEVEIVGEADVPSSGADSATTPEAKSKPPALVAPARASSTGLIVLALAVGLVVMAYAYVTTR